VALILFKDGLEKCKHVHKCLLGEVAAGLHSLRAHRLNGRTGHGSSFHDFMNILSGIRFEPPNVQFREMRISMSVAENAPASYGFTVERQGCTERILRVPPS